MKALSFYFFICFYLLFCSTCIVALHRFSPGKSKTPLQFFAKWGILVCWGEVYKALSPAMLVTATVPGALPAAPGDSFAGRKEESL